MYGPVDKIITQRQGQINVIIRRLRRIKVLFESVGSQEPLKWQRILLDEVHFKYL